MHLKQRSLSAVTQTIRRLEKWIQTMIGHMRMCLLENRWVSQASGISAQGFMQKDECKVPEWRWIFSDIYRWQDSLCMDLSWNIKTRFFLVFQVPSYKFSERVRLSHLLTSRPNLACFVANNDGIFFQVLIFHRTTLNIKTIKQDRVTLRKVNLN